MFVECPTEKALGSSATLSIVLRFEEGLVFVVIKQLCQLEELGRRVSEIVLSGIHEGSLLINCFFWLKQ